MKATRRFTEHKKVGRPLTLKPDHPAVLTATTLFPKQRATPDAAIPLFKSGMHSRKIGSHVTKGAWKGMPIYTLTLEERATCPRVCEHWNDCFGNKMHWSTRWRAGLPLLYNINTQLGALSKKHPKGFVIRLHVLGDFYSSAYVEFWHRMLVNYPQVRVFGYTRRRPDDTAKENIGNWIRMLNHAFSDRWVVRWSERGGEMGTKSVTDVTLRGNTPDGIVCPAQTGDSDCCGTCALCWSTTKPIVFITH